MRTDDRVKSFVDESNRQQIEKRTAAQRNSAALLHGGVKTLEDWTEWMRARGRYQWDSEE